MSYGGYQQYGGNPYGSDGYGAEPTSGAGYGASNPYGGQVRSTSRFRQQALRSHSFWQFNGSRAVGAVD